jgi:hypothetical protein
MGMRARRGEIMRRVRCFLSGGHRLAHTYNVYGDAINRLDCRSVYHCQKCGARFLSDRLFPEDAFTLSHYLRNYTPSHPILPLPEVHKK